ncbi:MAG: universal stress protein [Acidobacteriota bacterium]
MWTFPPKRIVVGVDFAPASSAALAVAGLLARQFSATVTAVHAETFEPPPYFTAEQMQALGQQDQALRRQAEQHLERLASRDAGVAVRARVEPGSAADVVLAIARDADLIAVGTHGRRGPSRWWLGSVAERVVRGSGVPVLVLHGPAGPAPFMRIGLLVGPHGAVGASAKYAEGLASRFGGRVMTVPAEGVSSTVAGLDAGVVVVPAPHDAAPAWLGQVSDQVLRGCTVPVLFVP